MRNLVVGTLLFVIGQSLIWFQTNGQFVWPWFKKNPLIISIVAGTGISYIFITATRILSEYYDGQLWPGRFIAFGSGIVGFTFLTWYFMNEGINTKTAISLVLAITLVSIQVLWK
tara:strand:- start:5583 stop:5927 length:345 start_codon:yes stop_codon:yes gene_type:complete